MQKIEKRHKYFEAQEEDEEVLIIARRHWIVYVPTFILGTLLIIFSLSLITNLNAISLFENETLYALAICIFTFLNLLTVLFVYISWLINYLNVQIVTDKHIVDVYQQSLFHRKISELCLDEIQDVSASQRGIIQSLLGFGNINVQTAGELPNFVFEKVKNPYIISKQIMKIKDQYASKIQANRKHGKLGKSV